MIEERNISHFGDCVVVKILRRVECPMTNIESTKKIQHDHVTTFSKTSKSCIERRPLLEDQHESF